MGIGKVKSPVSGLYVQVLRLSWISPEWFQSGLYRPEIHALAGPAHSALSTRSASA